MLCHVLIHVLSLFYKTYQFRGVETCLGFQMKQKAIKLLNNRFLHLKRTRSGLIIKQ